MKLKDIGSLSYKQIHGLMSLVFHNHDGAQHRTDGPAIMWDDGFLVYMQQGLKHRADGPALIFKKRNREEFWWTGERVFDNET